MTKDEFLKRWDPQIYTHQRAQFAADLEAMVDRAHAEGAQAGEEALQVALMIFKAVLIAIPRYPKVEIQALKPSSGLRGKLDVFEDCLARLYRSIKPLVDEIEGRRPGKK